MLPAVSAQPLKVYPVWDGCATQSAPHPLTADASHVPFALHAALSAAVPLYPVAHAPWGAQLATDVVGLHPLKVYPARVGLSGQSKLITQPDTAVVAQLPVAHEAVLAGVPW